MSKNILATMAMILSSTLIVGCGNGFTGFELNPTNGHSSSQGLPEDIDEPVKDDSKFAAPANDAMEKAREIEADVNEKVSSGQFDFNDLIDTDKMDDLRDRLADGVGRLTGHLDRIKAEIQRVKHDVVSEMQYFDPTNPDEKDALEQLQKIVDKLDNAIAKIDGVVIKMVEKLDELNDKLDQLINRIDTGNATGIVVRILIRKLKNEEVGNWKEILLSLLLKTK